MTEQLSISSYLILIIINTFIGLIASYSLGLFHGHSKQLDKAMLHLDSFKQNQSIMLVYIKSNCSQPIIEYPEFFMYPQIDLCSRYYLSLKLTKLVKILSIFFNIYLLNLLDGSAPLSSVIIVVLSSFLFITNISNDEEALLILNIILVVIDFIVIIGHSSLATTSDQLGLEKRRPG